jgi:predicted unusual protein kinase regulating ubiquinone biosynthesis (AarF/ABC1/UbiB family)
MQAAFRARFPADSSIEIPRVFLEHSRRRVLVSSYVDGLSFYDFKRSASPEELRRATESLVHFFARSFAEGSFSTDAQPGNFLFKGSKLYVVDFGSVKEYSPKLADPCRKLLEWALSGDFGVFREMVDQMGLVGDAKKFDYTAFMDTFADSGIGALRNEGLMRIESRGIRSSLVKMFSLRSPNIRSMRIPPEYVLAFRVAFSYLFTVAELGAQADVRSATQKALAASTPKHPVSLTT